MSSYFGEALRSILTGNNDSSTNEQIITEFKAHVKRDFVDLLSVPSDFEVLLHVANSPSHDQELCSVAFSTICHLVKRVSIQDYNVLKPCHSKVVPCLIQRLADHKLSVRAASKKLLQVYWGCCPNEVDQSLKQFGLLNKDSVVREACLQFLISIVEQQQQNFMFKPFTSTVISFLKSDAYPSSTKDKAMTLLVKFFRGCPSKNAKLDLVNELMKQNIHKTTVNTLLMDIDPGLIGEFNQLSYAPPPFVDSLDEKPADGDKFISSGSVRVTLANNSAVAGSAAHGSIARARSFQSLRPKSSQVRLRPNVVDVGYDQIMSDNSIHSVTSTINVPDGGLSKELQQLLSNIPGYLLENIALADTTAAKLRLDVEEMLPAFNGKETEFNWTSREKHILYLRSVLRGNGPAEFPDVVSQCFRTLCDAILKSVGSLRTSLSSNGCQLVKELVSFLGPHLDNVTIDVCSSVLMKLTSATKKIASQNAMVAFSCLISNISHHQRVFNMIISAAHDKNVQPRLYSATWMHIYILKNHEWLESNANSGLGLDLLEKAVTKCLADPNLTVRESMRLTFWCFYQQWPAAGELALAKLDSSTKKALERARPAAVNRSDTALTPKKRQSIRELIVTKNRAAGHARSQSGQKEIGRPLRVPTNQNTSAASRRVSSLRSASVMSNRSRSEELRSKTNDSVKDIFSRVPSREHSLLPLELLQLLHQLPLLPVPTPSHSAVSLPSSVPPSRMEKSPTLETQSYFASEQHNSSLSSPLQSSVSNEEDMIIKLLRSESSEMKGEAVSLLKYAFLTDELIDPQVDELLNSLSINDPMLLKPIFELEIVAESLKHLQADNFLRSFIIVTSKTDPKFTIPDQFLSLVIDSIQLEPLYNTCIDLVNVSNNISLVVNNKLATQFIQYKVPIFKFIMQMLIKLLERGLPIADLPFTKLVDVLSQSISFFQTLDQDEDQQLYISVMKKLHGLQPSLFGRCLTSNGEDVKAAVISFCSLTMEDRASGRADAGSDHDDPMMVDELVSRLYEMTMINGLGSNQSLALSDIEASLNDMTMIMPNFGSNRAAGSSASSVRSVPSEEDDDSIFQHHGLNFQKAERVEHAVPHEDQQMEQDGSEKDEPKAQSQDESTEFKQTADEETHHEQSATDSTELPGVQSNNSQDSSEIQHSRDQSNESDQSVGPLQVNDVFSDEQSPASNELITQIKNVNISSPHIATVPDIETIINKSDPFLSFSVEKSVQIYEDDAEQDDQNNDTIIYPKPISSGLLLSDTWFSFQVEKHSNVTLNSAIEKKVVDELQQRCLLRKCSKEDWIMLLIVLFQSSRSFISMSDIIEYLSTLEVASDYLNGLSLLMHNLKTGATLQANDLESIWNLVIFKFPNHVEYFANEMWFAVSDLIHELVKIDYRMVISEVIETPLQTKKQVSLALAATKFLVQDYISNLANEQVIAVSKFCSKYVNDVNVEIRKTVVSILAMLSKLKDQNEYLVYDETTKHLSALQHKLIQDFARLS